MFRGSCIKMTEGLSIMSHLEFTTFKVIKYSRANLFDDFYILAADSKKFKLLLRKSLLITRDRPILNRTRKLFSLELFY